MKREIEKIRQLTGDIQQTLSQFQQIWHSYQSIKISRNDFAQ
ncbi:MAG TPA: hypothetical protein VFC65_02830 [Prolixibacteraceae bacterium]|nr:hypothetical protein [Prolixibacteraceae bacterium]